MKTHRKVQVWIYYRSETGDVRYLVLKTRPGRGDFWQPVTGSVEKGEDLAVAALREATEETGLRFSGEPRLLGSEFEFESRGLLNREQAFSLEARGGLKFVLDPHEHVEGRWVSAREAASMIRYPSNLQMLQLLMHELGEDL